MLKKLREYVKTNYQLGSHLFLRCTKCQAVHVAIDFVRRGCNKCGGQEVTPTNISLLQDLRFLVRVFREWIIKPGRPVKQ